jgi:hypothetical protein
VDETHYADVAALSQFLPGPARSEVGIMLGVIRARPPSVDALHRVAAGALAASAFLGADAVVLVLFGVLLARFGALLAGNDACVQRLAHDIPVRAGAPRQDLSSGEAEVGAVEAATDGLLHRLDLCFGERRVGARRARLATAEALIDSVNQHVADIAVDLRVGGDDLAGEHGNLQRAVGQS